MMGVLEFIRGRVLARAGARFQSLLDDRVMTAVLRRSVAPGERARPNTAARDLESVTLVSANCAEDSIPGTDDWTPSPSREIDPAAFSLACHRGDSASEPIPVRHAERTGLYLSRQRHRAPERLSSSSVDRITPR
jgi:hypothetical protein